VGDVGFSAGTDSGGKKKKKGGRKKGTSPRGRVKLYAELLLKSKGRLSKRQAALAAGFSESMAENAKVKIEDPHRAYFERLANAICPDETLILKGREGLDATKVIAASCGGIITDTLELADFSVRADYIKIMAAFKGVAPLKPAPINMNSGGGPIFVKVTRIGKEIDG
jgi:hypothetical protein